MGMEKIKLKQSDESPVLREFEDSAASANDGTKYDTAGSSPAESAESKAAEQDWMRTNSASLSGLLSAAPNSTLEKIAMHPNANEEEWMYACNVLNVRENMASERKPGQSKRRSGRLVLLSLLASVIATGLFCVGMHYIHSDSPVPYVISKADWQNRNLKQRLLIQIAQNIRQRGWTEEKASKFLNVEKDRISALMNGQHFEFSADQLNRMAYALGIKMQFPESESPSELQDAVDYYTRVLDLQPNNGFALSNRADAYEKQKRFDLEIEDLNHYVQLYRDRVGALWNRSVAYHNARQYDKALADLNEINRRFPEEDIYQNRALIFLSMSNYAQSAADSTKSIQLMKNPRPGPYLNRAVAYELMGKTSEALADLHKVLEIDPGYESAKESIQRLEKSLQKK